MSFAVMVSHSTRDKTVADAVCARLEAAGFPCWIAPRNIAPGAEWTAAILEGMAASRMVVLVFSEHANASKHVAREVLYAGDHAIPLLPLRIQEVVPSGGIAYYLLGLQWLDAWQGPLAGHLDTLVERVGRMLHDADVAAAAKTTGAGAEIRFECAACGQAMAIEAAGAGLRVDCVGCGQAVTVPAATEGALSSSSPPLPVPPAARLPAETVEVMTNRLGHVLGPIARHLVEEAAAQVSTVPELARRLADAIHNGRDRAAFLRACGVEEEAAPARADAAGSGAAQAGGAAGSFPPETLAALKSGLAHHLGPLAGFLVDQAAREARTLNALQDALAAKIPSPKDRENWLRSLGRK